MYDFRQKRPFSSSYSNNLSTHNTIPKSYIGKDIVKSEHLQRNKYNLNNNSNSKFSHTESGIKQEN